MFGSAPLTAAFSRLSTNRNEQTGQETTEAGGSHEKAIGACQSCTGTDLLTGTYMLTRAGRAIPGRPAGGRDVNSHAQIKSTVKKTGQKTS
jgi:hypothetical protein